MPQEIAVLRSRRYCTPEEWITSSAPRPMHRSAGYPSSERQAPPRPWSVARVAQEIGVSPK